MLCFPSTFLWDIYALQLDSRPGLKGDEGQDDGDSDFDAGASSKKSKKDKRGQKRNAKNGPKKAHPYPCDQCESSFETPGALKIHNDSVHLGLKPFECSQCDKAYGRKGHLTQHIKSAHENGFVCTQCNKAVHSKQRLIEHVESVHEGIRHKCDFCDTDFTLKHHLTAHIKKFHQ